MDTTTGGQAARSDGPVVYGRIREVTQVHSCYRFRAGWLVEVGPYIDATPVGTCATLVEASALLAAQVPAGGRLISSGVETCTDAGRMELRRGY